MSFNFYLCDHLDHGTSRPEQWVGMIYREEELDPEDFEEDGEIPELYCLSFAQWFDMLSGGFIPADRLIHLKIRKVL